MFLYYYKFSQQNNIFIVIKVNLIMKLAISALDILSLLHVCSYKDVLPDFKFNYNEKKYNTEVKGVCILSTSANPL